AGGSLALRCHRGPTANLPRRPARSNGRPGPHRPTDMAGRTDRRSHSEGCGRSAASSPAPGPSPTTRRPPTPLAAAPINRLPEEAILSGGGAGTDAPAASYANARGLPLLLCPINYASNRTDAPEARNARMVAEADAAVIVWHPTDWLIRDLIGRCEA